MKRSPYTKDKVLDGFKRGWPLIIKLKKLSAMPLFERLARPFFTPDYNQLTALPIRQLAVNERVPAPENMVMPLAILERLLGEDDSSGLSQRLSGHDVFVDVVLLSFITTLNEFFVASIILTAPRAGIKP